MPIYTVTPSSSQRSSKTETPKAQRAKALRSQSSFVHTVVPRSSFNRPSVDESRWKVGR
ncbi:hypothetical protein ALPO108162_05060 [Alicyclobacillus pomorum]|jgi:hypothetical protein